MRTICMLGVAEDDVERHPHEEHVDRLLAEGEPLARPAASAGRAGPACGVASCARSAGGRSSGRPSGRLHAMPGVHDSHRSARSRRPCGGGRDLGFARITTEGSMDAEDTQHDPLRDAREAALRRIGELRQRSAAARSSRPAPTCARCWRARSATSTSCAALRASSPPSSRPASRPQSRARSARTRAASAGGSITSSIRAGGSRPRSSASRATCSPSAWRASRISRCSSGSSAAASASLRADLRAVRASSPSCAAVVGQPLHVDRRARGERAARGAARPSLLVRASVEDVPRKRRAALSAPTPPDTPSSHLARRSVTTAAPIVAACGNEDRQASRRSR